jgi:outer membrane protein TolC
MLVNKMKSLVLLLFVATTSVHAELTLLQAENIAINEDPMLAGLHEQAKAYEEQSIADGQLPDPRLKFGLMNFPTDTFHRRQEPMTQVQLGVQQMFPPGDTLEHKSKRTSYMGDAQLAKALAQELKIRRDLRKAWLETWYWVEAEKVVKQSQALFHHLVNITRSRYVVGGKNQQDVIRAELELEMLSDKLTKFTAMEEKARAEMARWIGSERSADKLASELPTLKPISEYEHLLAGLKEHPLMHAENAKVQASQQTVAIARSAYKPKWSLDLTYGARSGDNMDGSERADFASAMVMVDLPVFKDKRQDKNLAASQHRASAAALTRDTRYRDLKAMLDKTHAEFVRLGERLERYEKTLVPQAKANAEASVNAYQSDRGDFTMLIRARITELDTRLQSMRLKVDHAKAQAGLLYIAGDDR